MSKYLIVTPNYNDWQALSLLLPEIQNEVSSLHDEFDFLVIDDGSSGAPSGENFSRETLKGFGRADILRLTRNLGHQRALAVALPYIYQNRQYDSILVMDSDGEDDPSDISRLLNEHKRAPEIIVFARRTGRSEGTAFQLFYFLYRKIFYVLTGEHIYFGNFSVIPRSALQKLVTVSELWEHYASSVLKAKIPHTSVPTRRGRRLWGKSKMPFLSLVRHALHSFSLYSDTIGIRIAVASLVLAALSCVMILVIFSIRLFTALAIPGWASYLVVSFIIIFLQSFSIFLLVSFMVVNTRTPSGFIPLRDYRYYILEEKKIFPHE